MRRVEFTWTPSSGWASLPSSDFAPDLVLFFGSRFVLSQNNIFEQLKERFPSAIVLGASGGGQIHSQGIIDEGVTGLALKFEHSKIKFATSVANNSGNSFEAGRLLAMDLQADDLVGVFVLSEGLNVNGDQLIKGLSSHLPPSCVVCGGMAADDGRFKQTVLYADAQPMRGSVAAVGFYGPHVRLSFGLGGGWSPIGEEMSISLSRESDLYDLDGNSALSVYENHLGDAATQLPLSGLKFPLSIQDPERVHAPIVRTLLSIDRDVGIMTFAGDMPENWKARMMNASSDDLVSAAAEAAATSSGANDNSSTASIIMSCIGRRLVLDEASQREVAAVRDKLGADAAMTGMYSYGEFCTPELGDQARLFNQSMVVFSIREERAI